MSNPFTNTNLGNVIKFEVIRNLKKPIFWIAAIILPILFIGYIAFAGFIGYSTENALVDSTDTSNLKLGLHDSSGYISATTIPHPDGTTQEIQIFDSYEQGITAIKNDQVDVFYYLPTDFEENLTAEIFAKSASVNIFSNFETPLRTLLALSASTNVEPVDFAVISGSVIFNTTNFTLDNTEFDLMGQISRMVVPGIGLALFFILIVMFGNRLTTAMVEEKENRISEMILTSLKPRDLITGKIISLIILGFIQLAVLIIPIIILTIFGFNSDLIPTDLPLDLNFWTIFATLILILFSYFLFTALCVTIGTLVPTAKDASQFAGIVVIMVILPMFFITTFMTAPSAITYFLSYFPPSAPLALLIRNTFDTLPLHEYLIGLAVIAISSALVIKFAVYVYSRTAIDFTSRISLKKLLGSPRKNWK